MLTEAQLRARIQAGQAVRIGLIGDSVGRGFYCDGYQYIVNGQETFSDDEESEPYDDDPALVHSYAVQFRSWLTSLNASSVLKNYSMSSQGTYSMLVTPYAGSAGRQFPPTQAVADDLDAVIICLGINDYTYRSGSWPLIFAGDWSATSTPASDATFKSCYQTGIDYLVAHDILPILMTPNKCRDITGGYPAFDINAFNNQCPQAVLDLASSNGLTVIDVWAEFNAASGYDSLMYDEVHPDQAGHDLYANTLTTWAASSASAPDYFILAPAFLGALDASGTASSDSATTGAASDVEAVAGTSQSGSDVEGAVEAALTDIPDYFDLAAAFLGLDTGSVGGTAQSGSGTQGDVAAVESVGGTAQSTSGAKGTTITAGGREVYREHLEDGTLEITVLPSGRQSFHFLPSGTMQTRK